jgi:hypothetical protein
LGHKSIGKNQQPKIPSMEYSMLIFFILLLAWNTMTKTVASLSADRTSDSPYQRQRLFSLTILREMGFCFY